MSESDKMHWVGNSAEFPTNCSVGDQAWVCLTSHSGATVSGLHLEKTQIICSLPPCDVLLASGKTYNLFSVTLCVVLQLLLLWSWFLISMTVSYSMCSVAYQISKRVLDNEMTLYALVSLKVKKSICLFPVSKKKTGID